MLSKLDIPAPADPAEEEEEEDGEEDGEEEEEEEEELSLERKDWKDSWISGGAQG